MVDLDLEKFFDRVNHAVLMARVERKIKEERVLKLIRRYLESGLLRQGLVEPRPEGPPQGGPLSPLLSNILRDDLDKELERRDPAFCRYAADCNLYAGRQGAGQRVMASVTQFLKETLRWTVNPKKSAVARPWKRKFPGFSLSVERVSRVRVVPESVQRFKGSCEPRFARDEGATGSVF